MAERYKTRARENVLKLMAHIAIVSEMELIKGMPMDDDMARQSLDRINDFKRLGKLKELPTL